MPVCRLNSGEEVQRLKERARLFDRPPSFRVEVLFANNLRPGRQRVLERRLAFALSDCGCALASLGMVLVPTALFVIGDSPLLPIWPNTVLYVLSALMGAGVGKLLGLFVSYRLAHRALDELLLSVLSAPSAVGGPTSEGTR